MQLYFFFVLNYLLFILAAFTKIPIKIYIVWILSVFSIIAFCYDPVTQALQAGGEGVDLCRHFDSLDLIRTGNYDNLYVEAPLSAAYLFVIAELFENNHFLPLISVLVFYGISISVILKICNNSGAGMDIKKFSIMLFAITYTFFGAMNNIRYPISMVMFFAVLYYDAILNYKKAKPFYLIPCLMHPGIFMLLIARILATVRLRYSLSCTVLILPIIINKIDIILPKLIDISSVIPEMQNLFIAINYKLISYSVTSVYNVPLIYKVIDLYNICILSVVILVAYNYFGRYLMNRRPLLVINRMNIIIVIASIIGMVTNYMEGNFTARIMAWLPFSLTIIVVYTLNQVKYKRFSYFAMKSIFVSLSIILLAVYLFKIYPNWILPGI